MRVWFFYEGKRRRHSLGIKPSPSNNTLAAKVRQGIIAEIDVGIFDPSAYGMAFGQSTITKGTIKYLLTDWYHSRTEENTGHGTRVKHKNNIRFWSDTVGLLSADELTHDHILDVIRNEIQKKGNTPKTVANKLITLRKSLRYGLHATTDTVDHPKIIETMAEYRAYQTRHAKAGKPVYYNSTDQKAILEALATRAITMRWFYQFAFWTGLRLSEQIQLRWPNVDLRNHSARVEETKTMGRATHQVKTQNSRRTVQLLQPAYEALIAMKPHTYLAGEHVFIHPLTGRPFRSDKAPRQTYWDPALKRAGVLRLPPKYTRHTYASMMLTADKPLAWIAKQMGHSVTEMINVYGDWIEELAEDNTATDAAVELFWKPSP